MNLNKIISTYFLLAAVAACGQDLESEMKNLKTSVKENPVKVSGSLGASSTYYEAQGISPRRDPFYYVLNANLQISILNKISIPFSAVFTQQNRTYTNGLENYTKQFNQFGMSPRYRWLTVHAGYRTLDFSQYSLSGILFLGGGIEVKPEKSFFQASAAYGRFEKAVLPGFQNGFLINQPNYERWGGAAKIKAGSETNSAEFIFMKLRDRVSSLMFDTINGTTPKENEVIGLALKQKLTSKINLEGDYTFSMLSENLYEPIQKINGYTYINQIYQPRAGTKYSSAKNAQLNYQDKRLNLGLKYKRIDPDYLSLGTVFLTNDVQEESVQAGTSIFKNKLQISGAFGFQQNNLDRKQINLTTRKIGTGNINYTPFSKLSLNANYSNFSSNTIPVRDLIRDSIRFIQINQSAGFGSNFSFGKKTSLSNINLQIQYQQSGGNAGNQSNYLSASTAFQNNWTKSAFSISWLSNYNSAISSDGKETTSLGQGLQIQKKFFQGRVKISGAYNLQWQYQNQAQLSRNSTLTLTSSYEFGSGISAKADCNLLSRTAQQLQVQSFKEQRLSITLYCALSAKKKDKQK